jgi:glycosyltransferase involved in cell wall biosynthesis
MRIAQLAPLAESVPSKLYGGTERVIAWLVDELVELGHDVTLFASGDSKTKGKLQAVWPRALRLRRKGADPSAACALLIEAIAERARDFDVIHSHVDWLPLPVLSRAGVPFLTTMHGRLVVHHSDFDVLIPSHSRMGKFFGGRRISMLRGTPG